MATWRSRRSRGSIATRRSSRSAKARTRCSAWSSRGTSGSESMAETRLTVVGNELEAEMLCGMLRAHGIACTYRLTDLAAGMSDASFAMGTPREIPAEEERLQEARQPLPHA